MVVKWLSGKLKSDEECRTTTDSWSLLSLAFRVLPPDKVAAFVRSMHLIETVEGVLRQEQNDTAPWLSIFSSLIELLLQLSETPKGAAVKAALSVPATHAASFLGSWIEAVGIETREANRTDRSSPQNKEETLPPGIKIWDLRQPAPDEDQIFSDHCLIHASWLIDLLRVAEMHAIPERKRSANSWEAPVSSSKSIEILLARHIFLPGRAAFFKAIERPETVKMSSSGPLLPSQQIEALLEPIRTHIFQIQYGIGRCVAALPALLDVALRCVQTPTPRKRAREQSWTEAVFQAIQNCNPTTGADTWGNLAVTQLLEVIGTRSTLSKETLLRNLEGHSNWNESSLGAGDWQLLAQIAKLNADIFLEQGLADKTFSKMTRTSSDPGNYEVFSSSAFRQPVAILWQEDICVPVMKAYARSRRLGDFVQLWQTQLENDRHNEIWSVWPELGASFPELLEEALTSSQVLDMFDYLWARIKDPESQRQQRCNACIVILKSLLDGVSNESTITGLQDRLRLLIRTLVEFYEVADAPRPRMSLDRQTFALMSKALQLWFPTWAAQQTETSVVIDECNTMLRSQALRTALAFVSREDSKRKASTHLDTREEASAGRFIATVYSYSYALETEDNPPDLRFILERVDVLVKLTQRFDVRTILHDLSFVENIAEGALNDYLVELLAHADGYYGNSSVAAAAQTLHAIVASAVAWRQVQVIGTIVQVFINAYEALIEDGVDPDSNDPYAPESFHTGTLMMLPAAVFTRPEREEILDAVCTMESDLDPAPEYIRQQRIALLLHLMEMFNATAQLCTDPQAIWRLALGVELDKFFETGKSRSSRGGMFSEDSLLSGTYSDSRSSIHSRSSASSRRSLSSGSSVVQGASPLQRSGLLEQLTRTILRHLLSTQEQERSRSMIVSMSSTVVQVLPLVHRDEQTSGNAIALALAKVIICELEIGCDGSIKMSLPHREPGFVRRTMESLFHAATASMLSLTSMQLDRVFGSGSPSLIATLELLCTLPDSLSIDTDLDVATMAQSLLSAFASLLNRLQTAEVSIEHAPSKGPGTQLQEALVLCYRIACRHASSGMDPNLLEQTMWLLQRQLTPVAHRDVLEAFGQYLAGLTIYRRLETLEMILGDIGVSLPVALLLIEVFIPRLEKDDLDTEYDTEIRRLLPCLLSVLGENEGLVVRTRVRRCILKVLREKQFLANQYCIEKTLATIPTVLTDKTAPGAAYLDACNIMSALLLQHRRRLQGRFHLVIPVYQALISRLFQPTGAKKSQTSDHPSLTTQHAHACARLLALFCEPPQLRRRQQQQTSQLVDESRQQQAHVGQFAQYILHHYCAQILTGPLGEGMKEALMPGLWSAIEAMEMNDAEGIKSLSSAMNNSERAVLRGVYEDWKRFGKWCGG